MRGTHLGKIDSVRGIAALCVALVHVIGFTILAHAPQSTSVFDLPETRDVVVRLIGGMISGYMAVTVFFVISGFVLGRSLDDGCAGSAKRYMAFLIKRGFRLYPAHLVAISTAVAVGWSLVHFASPVDFSAYHIVEPADFSDWVNGRIFDPIRLRSLLGNLALGTWSMNLVGWTLYVEITAAPLLPLFHSLARRDSAAVDLAVTVALLALAAAAWDVQAVKYWFVFYIGMTIQTRGRDWGRWVAQRLRRPGLVAAAAYLLMVILEITSRSRPPLMVAVEALGAFSFLSLIVWCGKAKFFSLLEHPRLHALGRLSYSFYLWHFIVLRVWLHALYGLLPPALMTGQEVGICVATAVITVALGLLLARLSYVFIERPGITVSRRLVGLLYVGPFEPYGAGIRDTEPARLDVPAAVSRDAAYRVALPLGSPRDASPLAGLWITSPLRKRPDGPRD